MRAAQVLAVILVCSCSCWSAAADGNIATRRALLGSVSGSTQLIADAEANSASTHGRTLVAAANVLVRKLLQVPVPVPVPAPVPPPAAVPPPVPAVPPPAVPPPAGTPVAGAPAIVSGAAAVGPKRVQEVRRGATFQPNRPIRAGTSG